jgi:hypothetical protein
VPLIVITLLDQFAVTPDGNPVAVPIPVAFFVVCVIFVNGVFCIKLGLEDAAPAEQANTLGVNLLVLLLEGGGELPIRFLANTLKIYDTPSFKPFTVMGDFEPLNLIMEDTTKPETGSFVSSIIVSGISLLVIVLFSINIFFWE